MAADTPAGTPGTPWRQVPAQVDFPALEREVLTLWDEHDTFTKSLEQSAGGQPWTFFEGPPTANGMPGTHHIEARVFKDVFPRYRTMKGFWVERKAGWDCHGLPVEVAVEKELGFNGKNDIEAYGIAEFNARCRSSVLRGTWTRSTSSRSGWATGSTSSARTGPWTRSTSSPSGGRSSRSTTRVSWSRTTASRRTARAVAPDCPTTSSLRATRRSSTPRCTCASH